jgi:transposase
MYADLKQWKRIRSRVLEGNESRRQVCKSEGLSRQTLKKMLLNEMPPLSRRNPKNCQNSFGDLYPVLQDLIQSNLALPVQQRLTGTQIFLRMKNVGYEGCASTVRRQIQLATKGIPKQTWNEVQHVVRLLPRKDAELFLSDVLRFEGAQIASSVVNARLAKWSSDVCSPAPVKNSKQLWMEWLYAKERADLNLRSPIPPETLGKLTKALEPASRSDRQKALVILARSAGFKISEIAAHLPCSRNTVQTYLKDFEGGGVDQLFGRVSKPRKSADPVLQKALFAVLHEPPSAFGINRTTWKLADLKSVLAKKGHPACTAVISEVIKNAGYRWRSAKVVLTSTDPNYREKLDHIKAILTDLSEDECFFSIDEYGPFAIKIKGGRLLVPSEVQPTVPQWQKSKGCLIMTAALEISRNQVTHFYSKAKNTEEVIRMAKVLIEQYSGFKRLYLSWDAASWHISKKLSKFIADHNVSAIEQGLPLLELAPLPASAQFLNIIESVFSGMSRAIIHNSDYASVAAAKEAIDRYFEDRNAHFAKHPKRAGKALWGKERSAVEFSEANNCKDPAYR